MRKYMMLLMQLTLSAVLLGCFYVESLMLMRLYETPNWLDAFRLYMLAGWLLTLAGVFLLSRNVPNSLSVILVAWVPLINAALVWYMLLQMTVALWTPPRRKA